MALAWLLRRSAGDAADPGHLVGRRTSRRTSRPRSSSSARTSQPDQRHRFTRAQEQQRPATWSQPPSKTILCSTLGGVARRGDRLFARTRFEGAGPRAGVHVRSRGRGRVRSRVARQAAPRPAQDEKHDVAFRSTSGRDLTRCHNSPSQAHGTSSSTLGSHRAGRQIAEGGCSPFSSPTPRQASQEHDRAPRCRPPGQRQLNSRFDLPPRSDSDKLPQPACASSRSTIFSRPRHDVHGQTAHVPQKFAGRGRSPGDSRGSVGERLEPCGSSNFSTRADFQAHSSPSW